MKLFIMLLSTLSLIACFETETSTEISEPKADTRFNSVSKSDSYSKKKGLGVSPKLSQDEKCRFVESMNVTWYYDWGNGGMDCGNVEYVPMLWGAPTGKKLEKKISLKSKKGNLLYLNEPDNVHQSNVPVKKAIRVCHKIREINDATIIGVSATRASRDWFKEFMAKENGCIDKLSIHWYGRPNIKKFKKYFNDLYKNYNKPIWVTEFGIFCGKNDNEEVALDFLKKATRFLEEKEYIERYVYFMNFNFLNEKLNCSKGVHKKNTLDLTDIGTFYKKL
ncbi:MAG: hypothetical protein HWE16_19495 [Gammaproteobacteria bacterium]|nr:hypothetical protein [Gammaproteobacteria bacterium]